MSHINTKKSIASQKFEERRFRTKPFIFEMFKQKLYKEFQGSLFWYFPLLQYVSMHNFQWQVMWLWEFLVNTPIDENTD